MFIGGIIPPYKQMENTMNEYYLGIDGGGTKTHCALFSKTGELIDFVEWRTTSHEFLPGGYVELEGELKKLFDTIKIRNKLVWENVNVVYGMAGVDCSRQQRLISGYIGNCGVGKYILCNDSFLGIKAGSDKGWGICSMNGSGTGAGGIDASGNTHMVGRLFELSGDYAGGRILGSEVVSAVYDNLFRDGKDTILKDMIFRKLNVDNRDDLMEEIINSTASRTMEPKEFAPLLFEAACVKDDIALYILEKSGRQNARDIIAVAEQLDFPENENIPVVLLGSLYTKAKHNKIIDSLEVALRENCADRDFELIMLAMEPVAGAVCWAMQMDGIEFDRNGIGEKIAAAQ